MKESSVYTQPGICYLQSVKLSIDYFYARCRELTKAKSSFFLSSGRKRFFWGKCAGFALNEQTEGIDCFTGGLFHYFPGFLETQPYKVV